MTQCHACGNPLRWVERNHGLQQVHADGVEFVYVLCEGLRLPLGEGRFEVGKLERARPVRLGGRTLSSEDLKDLVDLGVTRKERALLREFRENAPDRPDVDRSGVGLLS